MKRRNVLILIFIMFLCSIFINSFFQSKNEFTSKMNFVVKAVNVSPTKSLVLTNDSSDINFWNFTLRNTDGIKVGDSISKPKYSESLQVYRRDSLMNFRLLIELKETSLFPINWY